MLFSDQSRQSLINLFERCARSSLLRSENDSFEISSTAAAVRAGDPLLVITTSSFAFRLLTIFQVTDNETNRTYFVPAATGVSLQEGFAEVANLCCGALNREIGTCFPHLAMSIPSRLSAGCLEHLPQLRPDCIVGFTVTINSTVKVGVTLCMCCTGPVEIPVTLNSVQQSSGELEMF